MAPVKMLVQGFRLAKIAGKVQFREFCIQLINGQSDMVMAVRGHPIALMGNPLDCMRNRAPRHFRPGYSAPRGELTFRQFRADLHPFTMLIQGHNRYVSPYWRQQKRVR